MLGLAPQNLNRAAIRTVEQTTNESVFQLPAGTVRGMFRSNEYIAPTFVQSVENGDFSAGITGWSALGATISASNQILSVSGEGTQVYTAARRDIYGTSVNDKIFVYGKLKVTNSNCINLRIRLSAQSETIITNPVQNTVYELYDIFIADSATASSTYVYPRAEYTDATTANGKVMEVDGDAGVYAINMTTSGLDAFLDSIGYTTDEQKEAYMLNVARQGWFYGMNTNANEITETTTDGSNTDTRTIDVSTELPNGAGSVPNGTSDLIDVDGGSVVERTKETAVTNGTVINTTNFPLAKLNGSFILLLDNGTEVTGIVDGNTTAADNGTMRYELATPVTTSKAFKPLATFDNGSYSATVPSGLHPTKKYNTPKSIGATYTDFLDYVIQLNAWLP